MTVADLARLHGELGHLLVKLLAAEHDPARVVELAADAQQVARRIESGL